MIDYRELLKKYIDHVGQEEGTFFFGEEWDQSDPFTEEEWNELKKISDELCNL